MTRTLLALATLALAMPVSAQTIALQDFDGNNTLAFVLDPPDGTFTAETDVWGVRDASSFPFISVGSGNFLAARDIENPDNPNVTFATATFGPVDVSGADAQFVFDYNVFEFDASDDVTYEVFADGVGGGVVTLVEGVNNGGTTASGTEVASIPSGTTNATLVLTVDQNGGGDYAGFDNFVVEVAPPVTSVTTSSAIGWRLLSVPVSRTVEQLAAINLVSGAGGFTIDGPAGAGNCQVNAITNLFTGYTGDPTAPNGGYVAPGANANIEPGAGFFWYFFGDTPASNEPTTCENTGGQVSATMTLPITLNADGTGSGFGDLASVTINNANDADGFYMLGNPFSSAFDISAISAFGATSNTEVDFQVDVQAWDPEINDYVVISADGGGDFSAADADDVSIWQGFFAERSGADPDEDVVVLYDGVGIQNGVVGDGFIARTVAGTPRVSFRVSNGDLTGAAAVVRFEETARAAWDRFDLSKLAPFAARFAQIGPVGLDRTGAPVMKAVESRSSDLAGSVEIPVAFRTSEPDGEFVVTWDGTVVPAGWTMVLRDELTGASVDLSQASALAFAHSASAPEDRFVLVATANVVASEGDAAAFELSALAPNPTAGVARMALTVEATEAVTVRVYDALGRLVATAFDGVVTGGARETIAVPTAALATGAYVVRVEGASFAETRRLTVTR